MPDTTGARLNKVIKRFVGSSDQPAERNDPTPALDDAMGLRKREELKSLFQSGYHKQRTLTKDAATYFRPWVSQAYMGFVSQRGEKDLSDYLDALADRVDGIVTSYRDPEAESTTVGLIFDMLTACDVPHIWHDKFTLRPMKDVSLKARLLLSLVTQLGDVAVGPQCDAERLFDRLIAGAVPDGRALLRRDEASAILRAALVAKGEYCLEHDQLDEAIALARRSFGINAACFISEGLLVRAWRAKLRATPDIPLPTDVAVHDLSDRFCAEPFRSLVSGWAGETHLCQCPQWVPFPIGNLLEDTSVDAVWNSEAAVEIRRSVIDGDFSYCSRSLCPSIVKHTLPKKSAVTDPVLRNYIDNRITHLVSGPSHAQLSYDPSCNLACPSCRTRVIMAEADAVDRYQAAKDRVVLPMLRQMQGTVLITGGGDPFVSKHWRSVLAVLNRTDYPGLTLDILTHGLLVAKRWHQFPALATMTARVRVSIDAARPDTYAIVRRPAIWNELRPNLIFLAALRRNGAIPFLGINFVVQKDNFREMLEFVQLGKALGVDEVLFQRMFNFGSFDETSFRARDVSSPTHPDHAELCEIFQHPLMHDPIVARFNLSSLYPTQDNGPLDRLWRASKRMLSRVQPRSELHLEQVPLEIDDPASPRRVPASVSSPMERVLRNMAQGKLHEALQIAVEFPATDPLYYYALVLVARIRMTMGDYQGAEPVVGQAIHLSPKRPEAYLCQAWLLHHQDRSADGLVVLSRAEQAARDVPGVDVRVTEELLLVGAWLWYRAGHAAQAREKVERYLVSQPDNSGARALREEIVAALQHGAGYAVGAASPAGPVGPTAPINRGIIVLQPRS